MSSNTLAITESGSGSHLNNTYLDSNLPWIQTTGQMVIHVRKDIPAATEVHFKFSTENPASGRGSKVITIDMNGLIFSSAPLSMETSQLEYKKPLMVHTTHLDVMQIGQGSPWPCDSNTITVSIRSSQALLKNCNPRLPSPASPASTRLVLEVRSRELP